MSLKKFAEFNYVKENILDDTQDENDNKWEVRINGETESFWEYKHDAIDQILEILDTQGEISLDEYKDEENYELSKGELADILDNLSEIEFYDELEKLKEYVVYSDDIKLINIDDDDEIEFLDEDDVQDDVQYDIQEED